MKTLRNLLVYGALMLSLTACPFLDDPSPLAPLPTPKTQKDGYKTTACRAKVMYREPFRREEYTYDAEGKLTKKLTTYLSNGAFPERQSVTIYTYNSAGFLIQQKTEGPEAGGSSYSYDANGQLIVPPVVADPNVKETRDANGRLIKVEYYGYVTTYTYNTAGLLIRDDTVWPSGETFYGLYDERGNLTTLVENKSGGKNRREWTYDDKPKPEFVAPDFFPTFKGFPAPGARKGNNVLKLVSYENDKVVETETYTYTYNAAGYPVRGTWNLVSTNPFPGAKTAIEWTNEYVGCTN